MPKITALLCHTRAQSTCTENTPRWQLLRWLLGGAAVVFGSVVPLSIARMAGYDINLSASMPIGIYARTDAEVAVGQIVAVCLPPAIARLGRERGYLHAGSCTSGDQPVLKYVMAMAGDSVNVHSSGVMINGCAISNSAVMEHDHQGRPLSHVPWGTLTLQHGQVWLMSTWQSNSWDSRYYGPVQVADVMVAVRPVLVTPQSGVNG